MKWQLSLLLLACCYTATAQQVNWDSIQSAIFKKRNLVDVFNQLEAVKKTAAASKDEIIIARAWYHQMQIQDQRKEDTAYFSNSYFIDSILTDGNCSLLMRSMMLVIKAKRVTDFRHRLFWKNNSKLFTLAESSTDFRKLTQTQLDSLTQLYLEDAKTISLQLKNIEVNKLLWLSSDPLLFLFKPSYMDLIFGEQLHYADAASPGLRMQAIKLIETKTGALFSSNATIPASFLPIFNLYKRWGLFHQDEQDKFLFIELLAKRFFYNHDLDFENNKNLLKLEKVFEETITSPFSTVKAYSIYELAMIRYELGSYYAQNIYSRISYNNDNPSRFDSSFRYYYNKALSLVDTNDALLDSFYYLKKKLLDIKQSVLTKNITIRNKEVYLPGDSISLHVTFKNVGKIYLNFIKLPADYKVETGTTNFYDFQKMKVIRQSIVVIPVTDDHQVHAVDISIASIYAGRYAVIYSSTEDLNDCTGVSGYFTFSCSNMAVISNNNRVFVLNRKTGRPMPGTNVMLLYKKELKDSITKKTNYQINANGSAVLKEENIQSAFAINGTDTLAIFVDVKHDDIPTDVYDKDNDDLVDYYSDEMELHLFTDRSIYRPGQKVFFKGILMTRDPKTGERIVVNKSNLKFPFIKKLFNSEVKELWKEKLALSIKDPFGKKTDSFKLSLNDYGSVSGSFQLKANAPTGQWDFDTDYIDVDNVNDGSFKVEEYKRPSFEVKIEKPTAFLQMGDSFAVKVKVKSFAGAQLNNVRIDYDINADFEAVEKDSITGEEKSSWYNYEIADTTGYTDYNGEILLKISADFLKAYTFSKEKSHDIRYQFHVDAIDGTGENHEENLEIRLNNRPVRIDFAMQKIYEKGELSKLSITAKNEFSGGVNKQLKVAIYKIEGQSAISEVNNVVDYLQIDSIWIYHIDSPGQKVNLNENLIFESSVIANTEKLKIPANLLQTGHYRLEVFCLDNENIIGEKKGNFEVFDKAANTYPGDKKEFHSLQKNGAAKGDSISWFFGTDQPVYSIYHAQYFAKTSSGVKKKNLYELHTNQAGVSTYQFKMPDDAIDEVELTHLYIVDDKLYKKTEKVYRIKQIAEEPQIIVEQYRRKLTPGARETFAVTIKTKSENIVAELMTVMYDASLDKIEKFKWTKPETYGRFYLNSRWDADINGWKNGQQTNYLLSFEKGEDNHSVLWWLSQQHHFYYTKYFNTGSAMYALAGRVSGISISEDHSLSEVVVVGFGTKTKSLTGAVSTIRIRGAASISADNPPLIIIDGIVFTDDFSKFNTDLITDGLLLSGADATSIYGSKAANGVILISTKGPLVIPKPEEPVIKIRKDFSETAFFYPQLHADADGFFKMDFTMPESVTQWNWKLLAHTKDAKFIFAERNIVTQLPLMVQPNMPRFLYQGDSIVLQARITNLDTAALTGVLKCLVEDAVTGENISKQLIQNNGKQIQIDAHSNSNGFVNLKVPAGFIHPLKITISVSAGNVSDGEEYTIPVMSKKILVSQSQAFAVDKNKTSTVTTPAMPADAMPYGVSMYIKPKPQTALLNALPYLAFYQYNCAEQTFNKMLAHAMAIYLARKDSSLNRSMEAAASNKEELAKPVADELSEETMPWMLLNNASQLQQQRLRKLMDTVGGKILISKYLKEIAALQKPEGGISWFSGGESSDYISCYLMGGFGKLKRDSISFLFDSDSSAFSKLLPALISFVDTNFIKNNNYSFPNLFYLYCRSFWKTQFPVSSAIQYKADSVLNAYWKDVERYDLSRQALLVITSLQFDRFKEKALKQLESIRQLAIADNSNGTRWKAYSNEDDFSSSDEETIALLAEAFEATGYSKTTVDGILQWLLTSKEQHYWTTTKATAAILNLLQRNQQTTSGLPATVQSTINKSTLTVTDNLFGGQLFSFEEANSFPASISVTNDNNINTTGGINYYYFSAEPPANKTGSVVSITKQQYRFSKEKNTWEEINGNTILKIADKIKTVLTITALKQLKYVFIDDKKAAALEPGEGAGSGYKYGDHIRYYQSVRDAGMQFFAESVPSGVSSISYETVVATEGKFYGGTTSLQCMYQPQVRTYAKGNDISVKK